MTTKRSAAPRRRTSPDASERRKPAPEFRCPPSMNSAALGARGKKNLDVQLRGRGYCGFMRICRGSPRTDQLILGYSLGAMARRIGRRPLRDRSIESEL